MSENKILFLSAKDVEKAISMKETIAAMKDAFLQLAKGEAIVPLRSNIDMPKENAEALFMPAYLPDISKISLKTVTINKDNPERGLPMIQAMVMVFDAVTGSPIAVMDGEHLTAMRTGAVSGLATDLLARKDAEVVAIIGTGAQGKTQLEAVCEVREIKKAIVFDLNNERANSFAEKMSKKLGIEVISAISPEDISLADIICTATSSSRPVFDDANLRTGVHINGVGSYRPDMCEIPAETIVRAKVVIDQASAALAEAGDLIQPIENGLITKDHIYAELDEIVAGTKTKRENDEEITVFKSVGVAVQDLSTAHKVIENARKLGLGTDVRL
jgi:ornithine cyclodeaminase/alanine dehydrogenase-like protein (mu-crystallin family)